MHPVPRIHARLLAICLSFLALGCESFRRHEVFGEGNEPRIHGVRDPAYQGEGESDFVTACSKNDANEREPVVLPGGGLAFTSDINGNVDIWYAKDINNAAMTRLTHSSSLDNAPSFVVARDASAKTRVVYYSSDRTGRPRIWEDDLNSTTRTPTLISRGEGTDKWPSVNKDGSKLLYTSRGTAGGPYRIYVLDLRANRHTSLVDGYRARWHPTQNRFVYSKFGNGHWSIYAYDMDTARQTNLSAGSSHDEFDPSYSPDGKYIAYTTNQPYEDGRYLSSDVWIMQHDGNGKRPVVSHPAADCEACWDPSGKFLFLSTNRRGRFDIIRIRVDVGEGGNRARA